MRDFQREIAELLAQHLTLTAEEIQNGLETPPTEEMGDYAFPCFPLAKTLRRNPAQIAQTLAQRVQADWLERVEARGAYLNFFLQASALAETTLAEIVEKGAQYGSSTRGKGKTVLVEFSSTNIAKPFHIGHIRSTVQGDALASIFEFLGYHTVRINYLGDYGTQFGMLICAYRMWGDAEKLEADPIHELLRLYVRFNTEAKEKPALMEEARNAFYALEKKDEAALSLWRRFKELSLREFDRVYKLLNIRFDSMDGEYFHAQFIPEVLEELRDRHLLREDEGAMIVDVGDDMPPAMVLKSNGSSTYLTRDIATARYRKKTYNFDTCLYVVASQQNLHFRQLREVLRRMGYDWWQDVEQVPFGMISLESGAMQTRSGHVVFLEDVLRQATEKTQKIMEERNPDLEDKETVARQVGIGAVKFQELYNGRIKDYVFRWEDILNFDGETGPYVQYTRARANRVVAKAAESGIDFSDATGRLLEAGEEKQLLRRLYDFPQAVALAAEKKEPSLITRQVTEIAKAFNKFYNRLSILNAEEDLRNARLQLTQATAKVIRTGLRLLGIDAPDRM